MGKARVGEFPDETVHVLGGTIVPVQERAATFAEIKRLGGVASMYRATASIMNHRLKAAMGAEGDRCRVPSR